MAAPASPPPPLLALPRELRNLIYSYLDAGGDPGWRCTKLFAPDRVQYHVHNAPNLSLLHAHPRLREEYLEAIEKDGVSVTISDEETLEKGFVISTLPDSPPTIHHPVHTLSLDTLFARFVKHVTILTDIGQGIRGGYSELEILWITIKRLASALLQEGPLLSTMRIGIQCHSSTRLQHHNNAYPQFETANFLNSPPPCLEVLQLVQRAEGYRLDQVSPWLGQPRPQHGLVKHGCYLYTRSGTDHDLHLWEPSDVLNHFKLQPYTIGNWNTPLPTSIIEHEMKEWREKHGHREAIAWF
ncbi:uncharacterized protein ALTATR162_LOCUS8879 [Alternaria atra]|jgi:hypothetical protein|uniref:Uncharacterized protein n=1 Tax=Alternaria atra TaxID=119953 RepID=A0A8J2IDF9_9PLEO|nr:uncharacterized protein ALTATR162_LOCUS8879 [Alternaria atra]CAG5178794.1 unnamed protein product [Alternaria atra]